MISVRGSRRGRLRPVVIVIYRPGSVAVASASLNAVCDVMYWAGHLTETVVLKVRPTSSDILLATDTGDLSVPVLLDLASAFNTVD